MFYFASEVAKFDKLWKNRLFIEFIIDFLIMFFVKICANFEIYWKFKDKLTKIKNYEKYCDSIFKI